MQILDVNQIREWDQFTIKQLPISSYDLMERAAQMCALFLQKNIITEQYKVGVVAGSGNNGGDGWALARMLYEQGNKVELGYITLGNFTPDTQKNFDLLPFAPREIHTAQDVTELSDCDIIIDAVFGSGLSRPIEGNIQSIIEAVNDLSALKIAIDIPSGLFADECNLNNTIVKADITLSFEVPKKSMRFTESISVTGKVVVLPIGLSADFGELDQKKRKHWFLRSDVAVKKRLLSGHKGSFGTVSVVGGSEETPGAPILTAQACLHSGAGLVALALPNNLRNFTSVNYPSLLYPKVEGEGSLDSVTLSDKTDVIAVGPGLGQQDSALKMLKDLIAKHKNVQWVFDADAINLIAKHDLELPDNSILTPHPGEAERLFKVNYKDESKQLNAARVWAKEHNCNLILKDAHSKCISKEGDIFYHLGGHSALAKGGSGDVLTGVVAALCAQDYSPVEACNNAIEFHSHAAQIMTKNLAAHAATPELLIQNLGKSIYDFSSLFSRF